MAALVKVGDVWLNPAHVVSVRESEICGVTSIKVSNGSERVLEYRIEATPESVVRRLARSQRRRAK